MDYKIYDYYEQKFGINAEHTSTTKGKTFIPLYNESIDTEFVIMKWPTYGEIFGSLNLRKRQ
jgi:hypothetical protein